MKKLEIRVISISALLAIQTCIIAAQDVSLLDSILGPVGGHGAANSDRYPILRQMIEGIMSPGGPGVFDMKRDANNLGINVLSGLVKVDRVRDLGRPSALSVRVLGAPVFNRGFRPGDRRPTDEDNELPMSNTPEPEAGEGGPEPASDGNEELPLNP